MAGFFDLVSDVLAVTLTIEGKTFSLGGLLLAYLLLRAGYEFYELLMAEHEYFGPSSGVWEDWHK